MRLGFWRFTAWMAGACAAGGAVAVAASCLPGLAADPLCGNGIIDPGEQCDPGEAGAVPGCSACQIDCGDGGFQDPSTDHCYFLLTPLDVPNRVPTSPDNGCSAPSNNGAHIVTFCSQTEVSALTAGLTIGGQYWVGLMSPAAPLDGGAQTFASEDPSEPGWAPASVCPGCFGVVSPPGAPTFPPAEPDAGNGCVVSDQPLPPSWNGIDCDYGLAHAVCEREPPGTRSVPCSSAPGADWCITVKVTVGQKSYVYHPGALDPAAAEAYCAALSPPGTLVIFGSADEREELLHELLNLPGGAPPPMEFWIGLSRPAANGDDWTWDDGTPVASRPLPWGVGAPENGSPRAFVVQSIGAADTQLTHSYAEEGLQSVCQH